MGGPNVSYLEFMTQPREDIRSEYDRLKKEAADQRANGFMGRVVLPTEGQTFEEFRDERKNSMVVILLVNHPLKLINLNPMNFIQST